VGRKTNEQLIEARLARCISVGQVIELLKKFPADAKFGVTGHFGEFMGMSDRDFYFTDGIIRTNYITPNGGWRGMHTQNVPAVIIEAPQLGPSPD